MDYIEWAEEYKAEMDKLQFKLNRLKHELNEKYRQGDDGVLDLKRRITILYSMYLDCKHAAAILEEKGGRVYGKNIGA